MGIKLGRNDPCSCGSGKKFKHCCEGKIPPHSATVPPAEYSELIALYNAGSYAALENQVRLLLDKSPHTAFAWKLLGGALLMQGKESLPAFQQAATLQPNDAEVHHNIGIALKNLDRIDEAVASYRRALAIRPDYAEAHCNLGNILRDRGQIKEAMSSYRQALQANPRHAQTHYFLANVLMALNQPEEAIRSFQHAIQNKPAYKEAYLDMGVALYDLGQIRNAVACYQRLVSIEPGNAQAHSNLGIALKGLGQFDEAVASCRHALELKPDFAEAHSNLLLCMNYLSGLSPASYLNQAREYGRMAAGKVTTRFSTWQCEPNPERLRVGLVSGDLREHSVGHFLEGLLTNINPVRISLYAYPTLNEEDALTARIKPHFVAWRPLATLNDQTAAQLIHDDGIHVLLDVAGHTSHNRLPLFAWKPAPVQCTWIGLPATTGVAEVDYVLGDPVAIPISDEEHFSEQVWHLPESYLCFTPPDAALTVTPLPALASGKVTFGSFNNLSKMSDATVAVWAKILLAVADARLFLKSKQLQDADVLETTVQRFAAHGVARDRLLLESWAANRATHLAGYQRMDIALDTFPYPGVTTSVEALWMGVPVVTLRGDRFLSRTAASVALNAGLADWVAADEADYVTKAVLHASDIQRLATLRAGLRQQVLASPLFDVTHFARNVEDAWWGMWQASNTSGK